MKEKVRRAVYNCIKGEGIVATIAITVIVVVLLRNSLMKKEEIELVDWTIFTAIVVATLLNSFSKIIQKILLNKLEDSAKLTCDYARLSKKYISDMIIYDNRSASQENLSKLSVKNQETTVKIPVICDCKIRNCTVDIEDSTAMYELPDEIRDHFDELFNAHSTSTVFNQLNIRVDDWRCENGKFYIKTSRTTYFDSLVTNRAMDFRWSNGLTIREKFEYGPYLHTLRESCLSNHLGFNGFIQSSDGYIPFVKRGNNLSVEKGLYGNSINASLKTKYALDSNGEFTEKGLMNGILHEIKDELKIPEDQIQDFSVGKNLIAAYRNLVEGGKPQLLFFARSYWSRSMIEQNFIRESKKSQKANKNQLLEDGEKILWIHLSEINQICILADRIIYHGKSYHMVPSTSACVVMLIEYLKEGGH